MSGRCAAAASPRSSSSGSADGSPWAGGRTPCSRRDRPQPTRSLLRKRRSFVRPQVLREPAAMANQNQGQCLIHAGHEHWSDTERKGFSGRIGVERLLQGPRTRHRLAASPARRKFPSARCRRAVSPRLWIALVYVNASFSWRAPTALRPILPAGVGHCCRVQVTWRGSGRLESQGVWYGSAHQFWVSQHARRA